MAKMHSEQDLRTVDDFFALVPDGQKADLIDGVIYMASPDSMRNDQLGGFIRFLLQGYTRIKRLGRVFGSRFAFEVSDLRAPEPDVAFVSTERLHLLRNNKMIGGPDVAVEIVSPASRQRDYFEKKLLYEAAGVSEYWIIDPLQSRAEFHRLEEGAYQLVTLRENRIFRSQAIEGLWLDLEWLFAEDLPDEFEKLQQLLSGRTPMSETSG
jgi:Uma2 family endonuclease